MKVLQPGDLCIVDFPFQADFISDGLTASYHFIPGQVFLLLNTLEIDELSVIETQILFQNKHMWFNIHRSDCNIEYVRRAESYDIPFMIVQEVEPGSNSSSLIESYPPTHPQLRATSHIFNFLKDADPCH